MGAHIEKQLIQSVTDEIQGNIPLTFIATGVKSDPNKIQPGEIYVPVVSDYYDGHLFIETALENGASASFWNTDVPQPETISPDFPIFVVTNTEDAVRKMAEEYLFDLDPLTCAVTGDYTRYVTKLMLKNVY